MLSKILSGLIGAVVVALVGWFVIAPSPRSAAVHFVEALPNGHLTAYATPALLKNSAFTGAVKQWEERNKAQSLRVEQGPIYEATESRGVSSVTVDVISHYGEVYPDGKLLNWEQDYTLTMARGLFGGWKVASVDTRVQAVVQVLGSYAEQKTTNLIAPVSIYLPQSQASAPTDSNKATSSTAKR